MDLMQNIHNILCISDSIEQIIWIKGASAKLAAAQRNVNCIAMNTSKNKSAKLFRCNLIYNDSTIPICFQKQLTSKLKIVCRALKLNANRVSSAYAHNMQHERLAVYISVIRKQYTFLS